MIFASRVGMTSKGREQDGLSARPTLKTLTLRKVHTHTHIFEAFSKLTVERRSCENINFIVQGPFVEAGLICLRILSPLFPSTENINIVT